jgi:tetratricopeptide (TPR) repeat protein
VVARDLTAYLVSSQEQLRQAQLDRAAAQARAHEAAGKIKAERRARWLTLAVAAALLVGTGVAAWLAFVATRARDDAVAAAEAETTAKEQANDKEAETRAVLEFVESKLIKAARPKNFEGTLGPDVTFRQALQAAIPHVEGSFTDRPLTEARLRLMLGYCFFGLGDAKMAAAQLERACALYARHAEPDHRDALLAINSLANSYGMLGRYRESVDLHEKLLALRKAKLGADDPATMQSMNNLGMGYFGLEQYDKAIEIHEAGLALQKVKLGPYHRSTLRTMTNLANANGRTGKLQEAAKLREETVALQAEHLSRTDDDTLMSKNNLAANYRALEQYADALRLDREVFAVRKETLGAGHPDTLSSMWGMAKDLILLEHADDAMPILEECLQRAVGKRVHKNFPEVADLRLRQFEQAKNVQGCRSTTELWEKQQRTDAHSLYQAAGCRAVTAKVLRATDMSVAAVKQAGTDADQAVAWLKRAVGEGYDDVAKIEQNEDFAELRERADFKKLVVGLRR